MRASGILVKPRWDSVGRPGPAEGDVLGTKVRSNFGSTLFMVVLFVFSALFYLWGNVRTVSQREAMVDLQKEREILNRTREKLLTDLAGLKQSSRIRSAAEAQGLATPTDPPSNLYLSDDPKRDGESLNLAD